MPATWGDKEQRFSGAKRGFPVWNRNRSKRSDRAKRNHYSTDPGSGTNIFICENPFVIPTIATDGEATYSVGSVLDHPE